MASKSASNGRSVFKLKVSNIPSDFSKDAFEGLFSDYGTVTGVQLIKLKTGGRNLGYVSYSNYSEAEAAIIALNNKDPLELRVQFQENDSKNVPTGPQVDLSRPFNDFRYKESALDYIKQDKKVIDEGLKFSANSPQKFSTDDELLYEYPTDLTTFNPYESEGPYRSTNLMYTRGIVHINGEDGRRHVACGRGYTYYSLPEPHYNVGLYVKNVVEKRERGLYEFASDFEDHDSDNCKVCSTPTTYRCQQCEIAFYCSKTCQKADWSKHKSECQQVPPLVRKVVNDKSVGNESSELIHPIPANKTIECKQEKFISGNNSSTIAFESINKVPKTVTKQTHDPSSEKITNSPSAQGKNFKAVSNSFVSERVDQNQTNDQKQNDLLSKPNKYLQIIDDDLSFESKESILPRNKFENVMITSAVGNGIYWVQKVDDIHNLDKLFEKLKNYANTQKFIEPTVNVPCVLQYQKLWYRANILSISNKIYKIFFYDYGTIEDGEIDKIVSSDNLEDIPYFAHKIQLSRDSHEKLKLLKADTTLSVKVSSIQDDGTIVVDAKIPTNNLVLEQLPDKLSSLEISNKILDSKTNNCPSILENLKDNSNGLIIVHAAIGHDEYNVTLVPSDEVNSYESLIQHLADDCENELKKNPCYKPKMGELICGLNTQSEWYRGIVVNLKPVIKMAVIDEARFFVPVKIVPISDKYRKICCYGLTCKSPKELDKEKEYCFKVIRASTIKNSRTIEICENDELLKTWEAVIQKWTPKPEQIGVEYASLISGQNVVITDFVNQNLIYVHSREREELERVNLLRQTIAKYALNRKPLSSIPVIGQMVLSEFTLDGNFYRAIIKKVDDNKMTIVYIDYGNEEIVTMDKLFDLPNELKEQQACVAKIKLKDVPEDVPLTKEATQYLQELVGNESVLSCTFIGHPLTEGVILKTQRNDNVNKSLSLLLKPSWTKEDPENQLKVYDLNDLPPAKLGAVGDVVKCIVLQYYENNATIILGLIDADLIDAALEQLPIKIAKYVSETKDHYIPRENELCIAEYDGTYYRAICLEPSCSPKESRVYFIDYGNTERVEHQKIREFSEDFTMPEAYGVLCNIWPIVSKEKFYSNEEIRKRFRELAQVNEAFDIKIISIDEEDSTPYIDIPDIHQKLVEEGLL